LFNPISSFWCLLVAQTLTSFFSSKKPESIDLVKVLRGTCPSILLILPPFND
jgi:hypothetical protein